MKVKLLKMVRNRYSIEFHPLGITINNSIYPQPHVVVIDSHCKGYSEIFRVETEEDRERERERAKERFRYPHIENFMMHDYRFFPLATAKQLAYNCLVRLIASNYEVYGTRRIKARKLYREKVLKEEELRRLAEQQKQKDASQKIWYK